DKATVSGLFGEHPGGSVSWKLYDNSKCEGEPVASDGPVAVTANGTYETGKGAVASAAGTYYWVASYSGDHENAAAVSGCADEPVEVAAPHVEAKATPMVVVLPEKVISGEAQPHGPAACVAANTTVYITGR